MKTLLLNDQAVLKQCAQSYFVGLDEAGRGALAGPVVVASVCIPCQAYTQLLACLPTVRVDDSKTLSAGQRQATYAWLRHQAQDLGILYTSHQASVAMIEALNVLGATCWAFKSTLQTYPAAVLQAARVVVDGPLLPELRGLVHEGWVKGDTRSFAIALASVIAKVERDMLMQAYTQEACSFSFDRHKGYGTALHRQELLRCGPGPWHRQAFVKTFLRN